MTILVSDMGDTVIQRFKKGTSSLADFTVLPKYGVWRNFLQSHPWLRSRVQAWYSKHAAKKRLETGFQVGIDLDDVEGNARRHHIPTLDELAFDPAELSQHELARKLAHSIKRTAVDCKVDREKKYSYEEWVEITRLIRFSAGKERLQAEEEEGGLIEWDWIGENSPMMAEQTEPEFVLERLCESMLRYVRNQERLEERGKTDGDGGRVRRRSAGKRSVSSDDDDRKSLEIAPMRRKSGTSAMGEQGKMDFAPPTLLGAVVRRASRRSSENPDQRL